VHRHFGYRASKTLFSKLAGLFPQKSPDARHEVARHLSKWSVVRWIVESSFILMSQCLQRIACKTCLPRAAVQQHLSSESGQEPEARKLLLVDSLSPPLNFQTVLTAKSKNLQALVQRGRGWSVTRSSPYCDRARHAAVVPGKEPSTQAQPKKNGGKRWFRQGLLWVWALAGCKWRAAASGRKPLRLPRARSSVRFRQKSRAQMYMDLS